MAVVYVMGVEFLALTSAVERGVVRSSKPNAQIRLLREIFLFASVNNPFGTYCSVLKTKYGFRRSSGK